MKGGRKKRKEKSDKTRTWMEAQKDDEKFFRSQSRYFSGVSKRQVGIKGYRLDDLPTACSCYVKRNGPDREPLEICWAGGAGC